MTAIYKIFGPIGQTQYRVQSVWDQQRDDAREIYDAAIEMGFRKVYMMDYGDHLDFLIEARTEEAEALFRLTMADRIETHQYDHDKARKFPPDWITKVLYYTVKYGDRNFGLMFTTVMVLAMTPVFLAQWLGNRSYMTGTMVIVFSMTLLACLRTYDDLRIMKHERKQAERSGLHEEF